MAVRCLDLDSHSDDDSSLPAPLYSPLTESTAGDLDCVDTGMDAWDSGEDGSVCGDEDELLTQHELTG